MNVTDPPRFAWTDMMCRRPLHRTWMRGGGAGWPVLDKSTPYPRHSIRSHKNTKLPLGISCRLMLAHLFAMFYRVLPPCPLSPCPRRVSPLLHGVAVGLCEQRLVSVFQNQTQTTYRLKSALMLRGRKPSSPSLPRPRHALALSSHVSPRPRRQVTLSSP